MSFTYKNVFIIYNNNGLTLMSKELKCALRMLWMLQIFLDCMKCTSAILF